MSKKKLRRKILAAELTGLKVALYHAEQRAQRAEAELQCANQKVLNAQEQARFEVELERAKANADLDRERKRAEAEKNHHLRLLGSYPPLWPGLGVPELAQMWTKFQTATNIKQNVDK